MSSASENPGSAATETRAGTLSAAKSASSSASRPSATSTCLNARVTQSGCEYESARASSPEPAAPITRSRHVSASCLVIARKTALTKPTAEREPIVFARRTDSSTAACDGTRIDKSWCVAKRNTSSTGGSIFDTARPAACAITAS